MTENPYVNKVVYGDEVLIDLSEDTVTESTLKRGTTAHTRSGEQITGELDILPVGGTEGDILVKSGATNYSARWEKPQYSRPNLLDNWYFVGGGSQQGSGYFPINQRGQASYPNTGWSIDRAKLGNGNATLLVQSGGLKFKGNSTTVSAYGYLVFYGQDLPSGVNATYSVLTDKGLYTVSTGSIGVSLPSGILLYIGSGGLALRIPGNLSETNSELFIAAKVEIGTYQTLAHKDTNGNWVLNEIPNYVDELHKCMRYYVSTYCVMQKVGNNYVVGNATFPVPMAAVPTINITRMIALSDVEVDRIPTYALSLDNKKIAGINTTENVFTEPYPYYIHFTATCE